MAKEEARFLAKPFFVFAFLVFVLGIVALALSDTFDGYQGLLQTAGVMMLVVSVPGITAWFVCLVMVLRGDGIDG